MTKTERIRRARAVRHHLALFTGWQKPGMQNFIKREWNRDPDRAALGELLTAHEVLGTLVRDLLTEGYGS